jgi:hypothetical protein
MGHHPELLSSSLSLSGSFLFCACCVRHVISCVFSPTFLVSISSLLLRLSLLPQCSSLSFFVFHLSSFATCSLLLPLSLPAFYLQLESFSFLFFFSFFPPVASITSTMYSFFPTFSLVAFSTDFSACAG